MPIIVYSKADCVQCDATYRALQQQGLSYHIIDLDHEPQARAQIEAWGYRQVPVVVAGEQRWSGFQPDRIRALG